MSTAEIISFSKKVVQQQIKAAALPVFEKIGSIAASNIVGLELNVSGQTILNYCYGKIKDGYLAEAIVIEFKKLQC